MASNIFNAQEADALRAAAGVVTRTLDYIGEYVKPGVSTNYLNDLCDAYIREREASTSATLGYKGFPKSVCTSVNNVVCHGIPSDDKKLKNGDIINIDVSVLKDGFYGDSSRMYCVGKVNHFAQRLIDITQDSLHQAIRQVRAGNHIGDLGAAIQACAESAGFSVVYEYCGHGIGREFHTEPQVPHYGVAGEGALLTKGMCFTIEPMINAGVPETRTLSDNWTVVTKDGKLSAQWEHMVYITEDGTCEVLTLADNETI